MTVQAIYDKIIWFTYGDSIPPASVVAHLQGADGMIASIHRKLQEGWDYWFMEASDTIAVTALTNVYDLPARFKKEISFRLIDAASGDYKGPMSRLFRGQAEESFLSSTDKSTYPSYYEIWEDKIRLYPILDTTTTMARRYYQYLAKPTLLTDTDVLIENGAEVIIYQGVVDLCLNLENQTKIPLFNQKYMMALDSLREMDNKRKTSGLLRTSYEGL